MERRKARGLGQRNSESWGSVSFTTIDTRDHTNVLHTNSQDTNLLDNESEVNFVEFDMYFGGVLTIQLRIYHNQS